MPRKMFKKRSSSPVLQKMANLLAEMRRPIAARLKISLKCSRKLKRARLLRHYNYGYIQEYEYSPSCTPSVRHYYYKREEAKKLHFGCRGLFSSLFLVYRCLGAPSRGTDDENQAVFIPNLSSGSEAFGCNEEREVRSIDERAEEFIERFYEEMRRQQYVMKQFDAMVNV